MIRSQLFEFIQLKMNSSISPKDAKNLIKKEEKYEELNSSLHTEIKGLIDKWLNIKPNDILEK